MARPTAVEVRAVAIEGWTFWTKCFACLYGCGGACIHISHVSVRCPRRVRGVVSIHASEVRFNLVSSGPGGVLLGRARLVRYGPAGAPVTLVAADRAT